MYNVIIEHVKFYDKFVEYEKTYGKPYVIKYIMNTYPIQQAQEIIQNLYKTNWR
jgi:hypothetical protein